MTGWLLACVVLVAACSRDAPPRVEHAGSNRPTAADPCPEPALRERAATLGGSIMRIGVAPSGRPEQTEELVCPASSTDAACTAYAREHVRVRDGYAIKQIEVANSGAQGAYEVELDIDGTHEVRMYATIEASVERAKQLQAHGKRVTVVRMEAARAGGVRVARVTAVGPEGPARRFADLEVTFEGEAAAALEALQLRAMRGTLELVAVSSGAGVLRATVTCSRSG